METPTLAIPDFTFTPAQREEVSVRTPWDALRRRRRLFALVTAAVAVLATIVVFALPKSYTAHVQFIAGNVGNATQTASGQTILPVLNAILDASNAQTAETYAQMLRQTPTLDRAISQAQLPATAQQIQSHMKIKAVTNTSIVDLGVSWKNPDDAVRIANALADAFVDVRRKLVADQADAAAASVEAQLPAARARVALSSAALSAYQTRHGLADETQQTQAVIGSINDLDRRIAAVEVDAKQAAAQLAVVRQQMAQTSVISTGGRQVAPNPAVSQLQTQLAQVDVQLHAALAQYTDDHPTVKNLRAQEAQIRRELASSPATIVAQDTTIANPVHQALNQSADTLSAQIAGDASQLSTLHAQRAAAEPELRKLPKQSARVVDLRRQAKVDQDIVDALQQKLEQANIAKTTSLSDVSVISRASTGEIDVSPKRHVDLAIGFVIALLLGLGAVFVAERFDQSLRNEQDVADRLALPILSSIPRLPEHADRPEWLEAATVDSYLQLVTALRYASSEKLEAIAFTGGDPGSGKSYVAFHTSIALAELSPRVLLVDADLRLPSLHTLCDLRRGPGLSDYLIGTVPLEDAVRPTQHAGLDVITAGTSVPNPYALLQSQAFADFLAEVKGRYDTVVIDTPACGSVIDAAVVCARADGTVYVVASRETQGTRAYNGLSRLRSSGVKNVIGAVLNKVTPQRSTIGQYGSVVAGQHMLPLPPPRRGSLSA